jgi:hypothetical protein
MKICTTPGQLTEGLFGMIFLHVIEVLPYLEKRSIYPEWAIRSTNYGNSNEDFVVIPGCLDLNYDPKEEDKAELNLQDLRDAHIVTLGGDWNYISGLWNKYFRWPERVVSKADQFPVSATTLGLHYRGTDKNQDLIQTNPVSASEFIALVKDFLQSHPDIQNIFLATDENTFMERLRENVTSVSVINSGSVASWRNETNNNSFMKSDHAMLDCLLLSRCKYLLKCQSALSGFAKILNPQLEAYRVSASKPFHFGIPYFPDAYIPQLTSKNTECQKILDKLLDGDWTRDEAATKAFGRVFKYKRRKGYIRKELRVRRWSWDGVQLRFDRRLEKYGIKKAFYH